ncbi:MAG: SdpI family protein [Bacteroidota bacterium]
MEKIKKEFPYLSVAILPFIYLTFIWNQLPAKVPMHMQLNGEVDRWGNKSELIFMIFMLTGFTYLLLRYLPKIDPKQKIQNMGKKFDSLRLMLTIFLSVLAIYILYTIQHQNTKPTLIFPLVGLLIAFLGNYMKTVKPNYFMGIRTPWTLENETVWKKTHLLGGKLWFVGGLLMTLTFFLEPQLQFYTFMSIVAVISIIPMIYSYMEFKKTK